MAKREFIVRWLAEFELVVEAENEEEAVQKAINRRSKGDNLDVFDFHVVEV